MTLLAIVTTLFLKTFLMSYCWFGGKDDFLKLILNSTIFLDSYFSLNTFNVGDSFWFSTYIIAYINNYACPLLKPLNSFSARVVHVCMDVGPSTGGYKTCICVYVFS